MLTKQERVLALLKAGMDEMRLLQEMTRDIRHPDDFISDLSGMVIFRACGMSLQYITESFVKIRNLCGRSFFNPYKTIPWDSVFGMRNFLSHEYGDVDTEGIFNTVKTSIPELLEVSGMIYQDVANGAI
ncbi:MAG: DUF86 domain-containing protein [Bacteroidales bacterium]|nr:DUF86 domain-containing protein [Bacteroidales bacterium]